MIIISLSVMFWLFHGLHFVNSITTKTTSQCVMLMNEGDIVVVHAVFKFNLDLIFTSWRGHKIVKFFNDQYCSLCEQHKYQKY